MNTLADLKVGVGNRIGGGPCRCESAMIGQFKSCAQVVFLRKLNTGIADSPIKLNWLTSGGFCWHGE